MICKQCGNEYDLDKFLKRGFYFAFMDLYLFGKSNAFTKVCSFCRDKTRLMNERKRRKKHEELIEQYRKQREDVDYCKYYIKEIKTIVKNENNN